MTTFVYDSFLQDVLAGNVSMTDTFYVMLVSASYVPDQAMHTRRSSVTGEAAGTGYVAGGKQVVPIVTKDTSNHLVRITFPGVTWPTCTVSATQAVYYRRRGGVAGNDELVAVNDFGATLTTAAADFQLAATTITYPTPI